jgi:hypothetical protein
MTEENCMASDAERLKLEFFHLGTQYYAAGRFAASAQLMPVAANLLHHAVEMYLKGALAKYLTLTELTDLNHFLVKAWDEFKQRANATSLAGFDAAIVELDKFEKLRYPDTAVKHGVAMQLARGRGDLVPTTANGPTFRFSTRHVSILPFTSPR